MSIHGKDVYFAIEDGGAVLRDLSPHLNSVDFSQEKDSHDDTTFGANAHTFRGGLRNGSISIAGMWDRTATTGVDVVLQSLLASEENVAFEYGPEGNATGNVRKSGSCTVTAYAESAPVADLITFTANFQISGEVVPDVFP